MVYKKIKQNLLTLYHSYNRVNKINYKILKKIYMNFNIYIYIYITKILALKSF